MKETEEERQSIDLGPKVEVADSLRQEAADLRERTAEDPAELDRRAQFLDDLRQLVERVEVDEQDRQTVERLRESDRLRASDLERQTVELFGLKDEKTLEEVQRTAKSLAEAFPVEIEAIRDRMRTVGEAERFELISRRVALNEELDHYQRLENVLDQTIAYQARLVDAAVGDLRRDLSTWGQESLAIQAELGRPWGWADAALEATVKELCRDVLNDGMENVVHVLFASDAQACTQSVQETIAGVEALRLCVEQAVAEQQRVARAVGEHDALQRSIEQARARVAHGHIDAVRTSGAAPTSPAATPTFLPGSDERLIDLLRARTPMPDPAERPMRVERMPDNSVTLEEMERERELQKAVMEAVFAHPVSAMTYQASYEITGDRETSLRMSKMGRAAFDVARAANPPGTPSPGSLGEAYTAADRPRR